MGRAFGPRVLWPSIGGLLRQGSSYLRSRTARKNQADAETRPHGKVVWLQIDDSDPAKIISLGGDLSEQESGDFLFVFCSGGQIYRKNKSTATWKGMKVLLRQQHDSPIEKLAIVGEDFKASKKQAIRSSWSASIIRDELLNAHGCATQLDGKRFMFAENLSIATKQIIVKSCKDVSRKKNKEDW
uniref:OSJNBa0029L02.17 protein n=1 Tax=Oryza sativa subsp. japonica TaxID=39947 RepID=Q7XMS0_ORYSJ|nr:OSJNBa0029L02.17 [Oryza sativa Japonica Group]